MQVSPTRGSLVQQPSNTPIEPVTPGRISRFVSGIAYYGCCQCLRSSHAEQLPPPPSAPSQNTPSFCAKISGCFTNYLPTNLNQFDSFVLYAIGSAITARNASLETADYSKIRYVGVWMLAEATFLAAIPLAVVEAVVRSAIGSFLFIAKCLSPLGRETLKSFYENFRNNIPMQIIAGRIAYTQLFENFCAQTPLTSKSDLIKNDSMNHFLRLYHQGFSTHESSDSESTSPTPIPVEARTEEHVEVPSTLPGTTEDPIT